AVDMMLKDLRLASAAAKHAEADTALGDMALQTYEALSKAGHGAMDFSVIMKKLVGDLPPA
ncbi:MAG: NAD-binding protein, partial [Pseudomonadota bacterium]